MDKRTAAGEQVKNWYLDANMIKQYLVVNDLAFPGCTTTRRRSVWRTLREALGISDGGRPRSVVVAAPRRGGVLLERAREDWLECHVDWEHRLPTLTTVKIPEGIDGGKVVTAENYNIEIAGGLRALAGKVWRIGLMGYNARAAKRGAGVRRLRNSRRPGLLPRRACSAGGATSGRRSTYA